MSAVLRRTSVDIDSPISPNVLPLPSMADTLLGAIDIMQEGIAQRRLLGEPPDVLLRPQLGPFGPFEYHRAAVAIAEGREAVTLMLAAIHAALIAPPVSI